MTDEELMELALQDAQIALDHGEVPIGCVIEHEGRIVARAGNRRESERDPLAHAEILAIRRAAEVLGRWRLSGCTLCVTLEPCVMCAGAIVLARIDRIIYGAPDAKAGAVESLYRILEDARLNHRPAVAGGVLGEKCGSLISDFFRRKRENGSL